jgi:cytochrome b561
MAGGMFVLVLMILRSIIRRWSARPAAATTGSPLLDRLASIAHYGFYVIVLLMIATGWFTGWLISGVFQPNGEPLPDSFAVFPTFRAHAVLAALLAILIVVHIAAAFYHQLVLKDGIFRRMWFGERMIVLSKIESGGHGPPHRASRRSNESIGTHRPHDHGT